MRAWVQQQDLPRTPIVSLQTATGPRNARLAEIFQSALGLRLVHSVRHELARLELLHLEVRPNGKVDHPTYGPVQTSDVADCFFEVTEQLIGSAVQPNLGEVLVTGTQAAGCRGRRTGLPPGGHRADAVPQPPEPIGVQEAADRRPSIPGTRALSIRQWPPPGTRMGGQVRPLAATDKVTGACNDQDLLVMILPSRTSITELTCTSRIA